MGKSFITLVNGGWGGSVTGLSSLNGADASENETRKFVKYQNNTWYRFRVHVTGEVIRCWIDDKEPFGVNYQDVQGEAPGSRPGSASPWGSPPTGRPEARSGRSRSGSSPRGDRGRTTRPSNVDADFSKLIEGRSMSLMDYPVRSGNGPLATDEEGEQRVGVWAGIPMLGLDALGSAAYGPEAALTL